MQPFNQILANTAVTGLFQGQINDAKCIVSYLEKESVDQESLACLQGLTLFSQGMFDDAISSLSKWTINQPPSLPHSLLAMFCWQGGKTAQAESYCQQVIDQSQEPSAVQLANDVLSQLRSKS